MARGEGQTDWGRTDEVTGAKLEASIANDSDDIGEDLDWSKAIIGIPPPKDHINIRIDHDVLEWFRSREKGYQTMMNNVLRAYGRVRQQTEAPK